MLKVPGTQIAFRYSKESGMESTWDNGLIWHFTQKSEREIYEMFPNVVGRLIETPDSDSEADEREIFGDTLDEPIMDEFWEMIE